MTHYDTEYTGTEKEKDEKAIKDVKFYLGKEGYKGFVTNLEAFEAESGGGFRNLYDLRMALSMVGIEGYPVEAIARKFCKNCIMTEAEKK